MADDAKTLIGVLKTRVRDGQLEGLCKYSDGSQEWKPPASVDVQVVNDRTGESAEVRDVKIGGASECV